MNTGWSFLHDLCIFSFYSLETSDSGTDDNTDAECILLLHVKLCILARFKCSSNCIL